VDDELIQLTPTDFEEIEYIVKKHVSDLTMHEEIMNLAEEVSLQRVMRFKSDIVELSRATGKGGQISPTDFGNLEYVNKVRALGMADRQIIRS
jgi:SpoVK/Ycf46/Vps4 family AAA+-type ATPase